MDSLKYATQGAHVFHWHPETTDFPVLFCSKQAYFEKGKPIRGGVPICWPWFGPREGQMQHGFVRISEWELISDEMHEDTRITKFQIDSSNESKKIWNHSFNLFLEVVSSHTALKLILTTENTGEEALEITEALHTYLFVGDVESIEITGLAGCSFVDKLDEGKSKIQHENLRIDGALDRIYLSTDDLYLNDVSLKRKLRVSGLGNNSWVIWNPWIENSKTIADLTDEEYKNFICIEAANTGDGVIIQPNESHKLETILTLL